MLIQILRSHKCTTKDYLPYACVKRHFNFFAAGKWINFYHAMITLTEVSIKIMSCILKICRFHLMLDGSK